MSEEELLAAVLEISKREASPSLSHEDDDKPTSSPDTGFAEDDIQEMPENQDPVETEKPKTVAEPGRFNENNHVLNKTQQTVFRSLIGTSSFSIIGEMDACNKANNIFMLSFFQSSLNNER